MGKKDSHGHTGPLSVEALDKSSRKRLEKIQVEWDKSPEAFMQERLSLPDLRLLLGHHAPLQDLIRAIVVTAQGGSPQEAAQQAADLRPQIEDEQCQAQNVIDEHEAAAAESEHLREQCQALQQDLKQCSATTQKLLQEKNTAQQALNQLEKHLQQTQMELSAARAELACAGSAPAELEWLRRDTELARRLELTDLPSDATQALIRVVAVLAQRDNLERLWLVLKERCEAENRAVDPKERALLAAALTWYNHNWCSKPYQLLEEAPGTPYDFERHLRSQHASSGERISELRLPGIADGRGRLSCKALVSTQ